MKMHRGRSVLKSGVRGWLGCAALAGLLAVGSPWAMAQNGQNGQAGQAGQNGQGHPASAADISPNPNEGPEKHTWTIDQLIPLTVSEAWQMSGRNEDRFFDMVQDLAAFSAQKRNLVLPEDVAAGQQAGQYIKQEAKMDHQQLLYAIVDRAVRKVGKPGPGSQGAPMPTK